MEDGVTALGLLQRSGDRRVDLASDPEENDEVLLGSAWSPVSLLPKAQLRAQSYRTLLVPSRTICKGNCGYDFEALGNGV